ncbi:coiled-coil domain-containing protein 153 [Amphiprion ocellaris]|nr:coiled-coil domain-containing protein 153 [Amphiprion ocellaris]XP_054868201.1 coiled-coil domain-containing protein 153 [Amphiprion ocellaris]
MEQKLQHERQDHRDVSSDLSRQYKTMQTELTSKVKRLEKEASQLKEELVLCQEELSKEQQKREQVEQEKDAIIVDLQHKLDNLETDYEKILIEFAVNQGRLRITPTGKICEGRSTRLVQKLRSSRAASGWRRNRC